MRAVILAGGRGTRLAPITFVLPKPLVPVGETPILEIVTRQLIHHGFKDITLTLGYLAELIQGYFHHHATLAQQANLQYVVEEQPTGTAGSLGLVPGLRESKEPFLVMNGDILTTLNFGELVEVHKRSGADLTIATHQKKVVINLGVLDVDETADSDLMPVTGYREKPEQAHPVSMGIYVYNPDVLDLIEPGTYLDFPTLVLRLLDRGGKVMAYKNDALWLDIGRPDDYAEAQALIENERDRIIPKIDV
jgi:NDP-sugar pyrophosphorylase family protein